MLKDYPKILDASFGICLVSLSLTLLNFVLLLLSMLWPTIFERGKYEIDLFYVEDFFVLCCVVLYCVVCGRLIGWLVGCFERGSFQSLKYFSPNHLHMKRLLPDIERRPRRGEKETYADEEGDAIREERKHI